MLIKIISSGHNPGKPCKSQSMQPKMKLEMDLFNKLFSDAVVIQETQQELITAENNGNEQSINWNNNDELNKNK